MSVALAVAAAVLVALWGVSHAVPTRGVVAGFGPITRDSRRILVQGWLAEAVTMWGIAALVLAVTAVDSGEAVTAWVYRICAVVLLVLAALTALTGARTPVVWFKVCPVLLGTSAALLLAASLV